MDLFKDVNELKGLMDKLIIQTLELIEEDVTLKVSIEKVTNEGSLLMAKTRYAQGPQTVSSSQLPAESEEGPEILALKTIARSRDDRECNEFSLESHEVNKEAGRVEPLNWFGILIPQSLRTAKERYEKATELVIESVNVEQKLRKNLELIEKLKSIKMKMETAEE